MKSFDLEEKIYFTPNILYMEYILIRYNKFFKNQLKDKNISQGELTFLYNIFYHELISQRELADLLCVSEAYVTKMLKKLENRGYIDKKVDENNKSRRLVSLTPEGLLLTKEVLKITQLWEQNVLKNIDGIEDKKFTKLLYEFAYNTHEI